MQGSIAPGSLPPNLRRLVLNSNAISGPLPGLPSKLTLLEVGFNTLTGSLPALPPTLTYLGATRNQMSGRLPAELPQGLEFVVGGGRGPGAYPACSLAALIARMLGVGVLLSLPSSPVHCTVQAELTDSADGGQCCRRRRRCCRALRCRMCRATS